MNTNTIKNIGIIICAAVFAAAIIYSATKFRDADCVDIKINIKDTLIVNFIDDNDVLDMIYYITPNIKGCKMAEINLDEMESYLRKQPFIRHADVYKTVNGILKIDIVQRHPIVEIITNSNNSFYIDEEGTIFPFNANGNAPNVLTANGFIPDKYDFSQNKIYNIYYEDINNSRESEIFRLARLINKDEFWNDQVEQIYVNKDKEFEIVPLVGPDILELGSIENYDQKLHDLKAFFQMGLKKTGWDTYKKISVKFNGQIVCQRQ